MVKFETPVLLVKNNTNKAINVLEKTVILPGKTVDIFKLNPGLSESQVIDALRSPNGELYKEVVERGNLVILDLKLLTFTGNTLSLDNFPSSGSKGQVVTLDKDGNLVWEFANTANTLDVRSPLVKNSHVLSLPKADSQTSGYLSREDWAIFRGQSKSVRIWQVQEFEPSATHTINLNAFESNLGIPFNESYIINNSAVISNIHNKHIFKNRGLFGLGASDPVKILRHQGSVIILDHPPSEKFKIYFLITLPEGLDVPNEYADPPKSIRDQRIELINYLNNDMVSSKLINGNKTFVNQVLIKQGLGINCDDPQSALDVRGAIKTEGFNLAFNSNNGYVLTSNAMGDGSWQPNPSVNAYPPVAPYDGQLWINSTDYTLFVFDGNRKKWLAVESFVINGGVNSAEAEREYFSLTDNIYSENNAFVLPYDATLTGITYSSPSLGNCFVEVHLNNSLVESAFLAINSSNKGYVNNLNVDFKEGDKIQLFLNGQNIKWPLVKVLFRKRL